MTLASFLSLAGGILGLLGMVGGASAFLVAGRQKGTIATLSESNDAMEKRIVGLKDELAEVRLAEGRCQQRLAVAEGSIETLTGIVTNARLVADMATNFELAHSDILALKALVEVHHADILSRLGVS